MLTATSASRMWLLYIVLALAGAAVVNLLPLTLMLLGVLVGICLLLIPQTPICMLVILLVLSPLRTLIATESSIALPLDIGQLLLITYVGVWLTHQLAHRRPIVTLRREPMLIATTFLIAALSTGAWFSTSITDWLTEWLKWVIIALLIWHLSQTQEASWRWLVFAVLVSAVANAIVGLYIFFGGSGADHLSILRRFFRAFGTFGQPNPFGGFMGIALPLALMGAVSQFQQIIISRREAAFLEWKRVLLLTAFCLTFALTFVALLASWSRGAWLGFAVSVCVMLVAFPKRIATGIALAIALAAILVGAWSVNLLPSSIVNRLTTAVTDLFTFADVREIEFNPTNYAVVERLAHWQAAAEMAQDHPIFGIGLGNYDVVYDEYRLINWEDPLGHAHNLYLNMLAEAGIVGLVAYLAFWLVVFKLTWSLRRHPDPYARNIAIGLLGCWTYIATHSIFDYLFVNNLFLHIGVLLSIVAILYGQINRSLKLE